MLRAYASDVLHLNHARAKPLVDLWEMGGSNDEHGLSGYGDRCR